MAAHLPTFNIFCNIWTQYNTAAGPPIVAPTLTNVPCNLQYAKKTHYVSDADIMWLLLPKLTDVRDCTDLTNLLIWDIVEVHAGSKRWYCVDNVDDVSKGFPTEYRVAELHKAWDFLSDGLPWIWPVPYP